MHLPTITKLMVAQPNFELLPPKHQFNVSSPALCTVVWCDQRSRRERRWGQSRSGHISDSKDTDRPSNPAPPWEEWTEFYRPETSTPREDGEAEDCGDPGVSLQPHNTICPHSWDLRVVCLEPRSFSHLLSGAGGAQRHCPSHGHAYNCSALVSNCKFRDTQPPAPHSPIEGALHRGWMRATVGVCQRPPPSCSFMPLTAKQKVSLRRLLGVTGADEPSGAIMAQR